jgi:hypothetical protein
VQGQVAGGRADVQVKCTGFGAVAKLANPALPLRPTAIRALRALRDGGPQHVDQLAARLNTSGRRPLLPATVAGALEELHAAGLATLDVADQDELTGRWVALPVARDPCWMRSTCTAPTTSATPATWLEDAGIPARVIDKLMGHEATGRTGQQRGSAMGAHYRHTTPDMAGRIAIAIEQRLTVVLKVAEQVLEAQPRRSTQRVFERPQGAFSGKSLANDAASGRGRCVVPGGAEGI